MQHPLQCACGTVQGSVAIGRAVGRAVCYCRDCQSYAHALGDPRAILDADGGTDVAPTLQQGVAITRGLDAIACLSLTDKGLLRWYARCCKTPLGNTARDWRLSYIGVLHTCLGGSAERLDAAFGPVRVHINTQWAQRKIAAQPFAAVAFVARLAPRIIRASLDGGYRRSPLFDAGGRPIVRVDVLSSAELARIRQAIRRRAAD